MGNGTSAAAMDHGREAPNVAQSGGESDAGEQEFQPTVPHLTQTTPAALGSVLDATSIVVFIRIRVHSSVQTRTVLRHLTIGTISFNSRLFLSRTKKIVKISLYKRQKVRIFDFSDQNWSTFGFYC